MTRYDRRHLFYLYMRESWRRARRRLALTHFAMTRATVKIPERLVVAPTDLRIIDPFVAEEIIADRFPLAGRLLATEGESPFLMPPPSPAFEARLHAFGWLRHIRADKSDEACLKARRLVDQWIQTQGKRFDSAIWSIDIAAQRLIAWLSHSPVVLQGAESHFYRRFMKSIAVHIRYLRRMTEHCAAPEARFRARIALAMASMALPLKPAAVRKAGLDLDRELEAQIGVDGGHISRNPRVALDLLFDLLPLRQTYVNLGHDVPGRLIQGIDRMYPALRFFRHQSGDLALFNGATATLANELLAVLRYDETAGKPFRSLPHLDYHRLAAEGTVVLVDTGMARSSDLSRAAHAGSLSFEMSSGRYRFITNSGAPRFAGPDYRQAARVTAAHSTVVVNETSSAQFSESDFLGPVMLGGIETVTAEREQSASGADRLIASHDGYLAPFGLIHEREIVLSADGARLRGADRFHARAKKGMAPPPSHATARFHVHPAIAIVPKSDDTVLLAAPDGESWLFTCPGFMVEITEDIFFADASGLRKSEQLEISFSIAETPEIRWEFKRA